MTGSSIEVSDDPRYPEGGRAILLWRGVAAILQDEMLSITPIDEALGIQTLRVKAEGRVSPQGLELELGPAIVDVLRGGIGVAIALERAGLGAEILWPSLTPSEVSRPQRTARLASAGRRRVVESVAGAPPRVAPPVPARTQSDPSSEIAAAHAANAAAGSQEPRPERADAAPTDAPGSPEPGQGEASGAADRAAIGPPPHQAEIREAARPAISRTLAIAAICASLVSGAAAGWLLRGPRDASPPPEKNDAPAPLAQLLTPALPYDFLAPLSEVSPLGKPVRQDERAAFLRRGLGVIETNREEGEFWIKWAARAMLSGANPNAAATLSSLAFVIAKSNHDDAGVVSARFLWELAAAGGDCVAIKNLSVAHEGSSIASYEASEAQKWKDRAKVNGCN